MGYVFVRGIPQISWEFLSTVPSTLKGTNGIVGNIVNTLYIIVITLVIATPIGVGAAIYLNEYARPGRLVRLIEFTNGDALRHSVHYLRIVRHGVLRNSLKWGIRFLLAPSR